MRVPTMDVPRRSFGPRLWLIVAAILLLLLITSMRGIARFYTDYLWFAEVGFSRPWRSLLGAKIVPAVIFSALFFVVLLVNLYVADRVAPRGRAMGTEDEIIEKYRTYVAPYSGRLRVGVALFFAVVMGGGVSAQWRDWILFSNSVSFHQKDPQFHRDISFYVFRLPFLQFAIGWAFAAFLVILIVTAVFHYVNGGIRLQSPFQRVTPQVKVHLSVILALMALTKTVQYYLARFQLLFSHRGVVDGAGYTDVKAQLPALNLLMIISIAAAVLFIANIFRRGWVFPIIAVGLWGFISIVVGTIYPAYIQRFQVQPNEYSREAPYIQRNITATRAAFQLDAIHEQNYNYQENLDASDVRDNIATFENARLWDPKVLNAVYTAIQPFKTYLTFTDVDVDRYKSGVDSVPALIAARELDSTQLPSRTWTNTHLVYTHGYGAVISAGNSVQVDNPSFLLKDIPPTGEASLKLNVPDIYYGEDTGSFAVVHTKAQEIEPTGARVRYNGKGGVRASSFVRKAALALRFGSWNLFVSGQLTHDSRVIYNRNILDRVRTAAPFLRFDADPYSVVVDGRVVWVVDAYTTTNNYPYSQSIHPQSLTSGSGLDTNFNYVRNSVKATVDAYDGTIKFYVIDTNDPIVKAYEKAFPQLFTDKSQVPEQLQAHFRYPEDLFSAQTEQYTLYHMTNSRQFYGKADLWDIASEPSTTGAVSTVSTTAVGGNNGGRNSTLNAGTTPITPLYQMMQLPGQTGQEFVLTRSFVPRGKDNQLTAFLAARSDPGHYGQLMAYNTPDTIQVPSPSRAATLIESDPAISKQLSLLDQRGSKVDRGEVQLLPIKDSVVYVRPFWVEGTGGGSYPRFRRVAMTYGESAVLATSIQDGLNFLFHTGTTGNTTPPPTPGGPVTPSSVASLLTRAQNEYNLAIQALNKKDLGGYQDHITAMEKLITQAQNTLTAAGSSGSTTSTSTPSTTRPGTTTTTTAPRATTTTAGA
ncbi:MAG: hypothetical protein JWL83_397 [Actinomycetia bacterium]|nr:hypothetical protein [Actinomycetes bacterium]